MAGKQRGFTLIEILVVITIIGVLAALVVVLIPKGQFEAKKTECMNNVRNLVGLVETGGEYPKFGGANFILYLVNHGELKGQDQLKTLFCPGDTKDGWDSSGGVDAFKDLNLDKREYDRLTSYAGRDQTRTGCRAAKGGTQESIVLICDDSDDHHQGKGFIVGLSGGSTKFRDKVDDYGGKIDTPVQVGEGSSVEELKCLSGE